MGILTNQTLVIGIIPVLIGVVSVLSLYRRVSSSGSPNASLLGNPKNSKGRNPSVESLYTILKKNYPTHRDTIYKTKQPFGDVLVLPLEYVDELKALPEDVLAFDLALDERYLGKYTLFSHSVSGLHPSTVPRSVTNNLTRNLSPLMKEIAEECELAFNHIIGPCEEWTEVNIWHKLVPIIAQISSRVFIGPEHCHDPEYIRCIIQFASQVFQAAGALRRWNPWLRPVVYRFIPEVRTVWNSYKTMIKIMTGVVPARLADIDAGNPTQDMVTWNILNSERGKRSSIRVQAHAQLVLSMAAIHTSSLTASHILYDLAAYPEYIGPLRTELDSVLSTQSDPWLDKSSIPRLKLLDSFFKESQRLNPLSITGFNRKAMQDIILHDGETIPAGTHIACASAEVMRDPEFYSNPDTFDGYRYFNLRSQSEEGNLHHFVSVSIDNMNWGYGPHACPGRFFANTQLKMIVTHVLQQYDLKMPEGKGRPGTVIMPSGLGPDVSQALLMKRRS